MHELVLTAGSVRLAPLSVAGLTGYVRADEVEAVAAESGDTPAQVAAAGRSWIMEP